MRYFIQYSVLHRVMHKLKLHGGTERKKFEISRFSNNSNNPNPGKGFWAYIKYKIETPRMIIVKRWERCH